MDVVTLFPPFSTCPIDVYRRHVVCGDANGEVTIRRILGLAPVASTISVLSPVEDIVLAPRGTQLLVARKDGKVVVIAPNLPL